VAPRRGTARARDVTASITAAPGIPGHRIHQEVTVLFHVRMDVSLPHDLDSNRRAELVQAERDRTLELQKMGVWQHLWRVVGLQSNISIFDVPSNDELHAFLSSLPLWEFMRVQVTPLATHPSDLEAQP
jgi:muconolactone D-isomerase